MGRDLQSDLVCLEDGGNHWMFLLLFLFCYALFSHQSNCSERKDEDSLRQLENEVVLYKVLSKNFYSLICSMTMSIRVFGLL